MADNSKRMKKIAEDIKELGDNITANAALDILRDMHKKNGVKFDQTVELVLALSIDPRSSSVRGAKAVPNSLGKNITVCCYTNDEDNAAITEMGVDAVGGEELLNSIINGEQKCDLLITLKKEMAKIGKFGRQLGGKGLMPNPKDGTIAEDLKQLKTIIQSSKIGIAQFKNDKAGIIHVAIGKITASNDALVENLKFIVAEVKRLKPAKAKGKYIKKVYLSTTMGPSILVSPLEVE
jgi:large subunit ribosomal protein L1